MKQQVTAVAKSPKVDTIYCAPGNAGIAKVAECVPIGVMEFDKLADLAKEKEIDLAIMDYSICLPSKLERK